MSRRWLGQLLVCLLAAALSGCAARQFQSPLATEPVRVLRNGDIGPEQPAIFRFQDFNEPLLDELLTREHLRRVADPRATQFKQITQLREWVAAQWKLGTPTPYPPWNAITILDWIRSGKTGGHCGQYSQVMLQAAAALGFTARYVEVGSQDNPYAHFVTEVWSNDYNKWVVMDASYNSHFELNGVPLGALEIHDALIAGQARRVNVNRGRMTRGRSNPMKVPLRTVELYYYVRFHLKADQLTKTGEPPMDRLNDMIEFEDPRTTPWEAATVPSDFPKERLTRQRTGDRRVLTPLLNQIRIDATMDGTQVAIAAREAVLQFRDFEYRIVGHGRTGAWQQQTGSTIRLPWPVGRETVEVRGVNIRGVGGPVVTVALRGSR